jgi:hypothetical protein
VGPSGVTVNHSKEFDANAKWAYLDGNLNDKVDDETAARIAYAHKKIPELFSKVKTDAKIIYPFSLTVLMAPSPTQTWKPASGKF